MTTPKINPERLLADLHALRQIGACGNGVVRPVFSAKDMEARQWLKQRMLDAGLDAKMDGLANVIGYSGKTGPTLLMGSHTDTQPTGGWLDGAYGVICALEVNRALAECPETAHMSVDIASWADEEHTYHGFLGCKGFLGQMTPEIIAESKNADGHLLSDALKEAALDGTSESYDPERYIAYLEAHIEQGPRLDMANQQAGVVTGIVGCRDFDISFTGEMNHAGSTPMDMRKDAGMALIEYGHQINKKFREIAGQYTVWTIGRAEFTPGAACVIPGHAVMKLQFRDTSEEVLDRLEACMKQMAKDLAPKLKTPINIEAHHPAPAVVLDSKIQEILRETAEQQLPGKWQSLPSAAMHDANIFAGVMPSGMLFVPSINGISHSFDEDTKEEDLVAGCQLLATAAAKIIRQAS